MKVSQEIPLDIWISVIVICFVISNIMFIMNNSWLGMVFFFAGVFGIWFIYPTVRKY